jgi:hypothetical protein
MKDDKNKNQFDKKRKDNMVTDALYCDIVGRFLLSMISR